MQITIDTNNLSEMDINMLSFLAEQGEVQNNVEPDEEELELEIDEDDTVDRAAEAAAAKKEAAAAKKEAAAAKKAEEATEEEATDDDAPTMSDAVAAATKLVSSGQAALVKTALAKVEVKRVSEMDVADIPTFLAALEEGE
jgi:hypothetical protein